MQERQAHEAVKEIRQGYPQAFSRLVELYSGHLYQLCRGLLGNQHDAEEAVQEVFLLVHKALPKFKDECRFHPWIYTIAVNHVRSLLRKKRNRAFIRFTAYPESRGPDAYESPMAGPVDALMETETAAVIDSALARLKPSRREIFLLRRVKGLTIQETAAVLGLTESKVKTELFRATGELARAVLGEGENP